MALLLWFAVTRFRVAVFADAPYPASVCAWGTQLTGFRLNPSTGRRHRVINSAVPSQVTSLALVGIRSAESPTDTPPRAFSRSPALLSVVIRKAAYQWVRNVGASNASVMQMLAKLTSECKRFCEKTSDKFSRAIQVLEVSVVCCLGRGLRDLKMHAKRGAQVGRDARYCLVVAFGTTGRPPILGGAP